MRRDILAALAVAVLVLPATADAQTPPERRGASEQRPRADRMGMPAGDPAARILELRDQLGLTEAQAAQIGEIQARLQEQNAPLLEQLSAARDSMRTKAEQMTPEQREAMRERMRAARQDRSAGPRQRPGSAQPTRPDMPAELRPVMEQLRTNTRNAAQQIRAVLTAEQQEKLRELRPARRQGERGVRPPASGVR